jgi:hypothetical protein
MSGRAENFSFPESNPEANKISITVLCGSTIKRKFTITSSSVGFRLVRVRSYI